MNRSASRRGDVRVSVLIPVRNGAQTIAAAITSVLEDVSNSDEIIVINDGSVDDTMSILASFARQIKILDNRGSGIVDALNTGLADASGDFIARCDADDEWKPGHIGALIEPLIHRQDVVAVFGAAELRGTDGLFVTSRTPPCEGPDLAKAMLRGNPFIHGTVLARRDAVEGLGGYRHVRGAEDFDLWMRLSRAGSIIAIDESVYVYQLSAPSSHSRKRVVQARSTLKVLFEHAIRTGNISLVGIARNAFSSVWIWRRFWYQSGKC